MIWKGRLQPPIWNSLIPFLNVVPWSFGENTNSVVSSEHTPRAALYPSSMRGPGVNTTLANLRYDANLSLMFPIRLPIITFLKESKNYGEGHGEGFSNFVYS